MTLLPSIIYGVTVTYMFIGIRYLKNTFQAAKETFSCLSTMTEPEEIISFEK